MRYLPLTKDDRAAMLAKIGVRDADALFRDVPQSAHVERSAFDLPDTQGELDVARAPVLPGREEDLIKLIDDKTACVVVQSPDVFGLIRNLKPIADTVHAKGALLIAVVTEAVSFGLLEPPGSQGADIVAAEGQSIGNGLNFGGPYVGLFATREKFIRQMPGRLSGETIDAAGKRGYVLTLSTREQHIRRE